MSNQEHTNDLDVLLEEYHEEFKNDPEYRAIALYDAITADFLRHMKKHDISRSELAQRMELDNRPIKRPNQIAEEDKSDSIETWFEAHGVQKKARDMFLQLDEYIKSLDEECFHNVGSEMVSFYCPERVFLYLTPRKTILRLWLFTSGDKLDKVEAFGYSGMLAPISPLSYCVDLIRLGYLIPATGSIPYYKL